MMKKSKRKLTKKKRKQLPKSMSTNMVMDTTHRRSIITTLSLIIRHIAVTRRCTIKVLIRSTTVMCRNLRGILRRRRLRIILDFMVMGSIARMNNVQIENRPKKTMISIQDLKMPSKKPIDPNVGPNSSQDN